MKKLALLTLVFLLCLSLCSCGVSNNEETTAVETELPTETIPEETTTSVDEDHFQVTADNGTVLNIEKPKDSVEVTRNDGTVETLSSLELAQIYLDNKIKFEKNYEGAYVKIIAPVEEVHGRTIMDGHELSSYIVLSGRWTVEVAEDHPLLEELSRGDMVVVTGAIYKGGCLGAYNGIAMMGSCYVYSIEGAETTLELYSE